eukprot:3492895-Pyramimonas_sp.AAC.1
MNLKEGALREEEEEEDEEEEDEEEKEEAEEEEEEEEQEEQCKPKTHKRCCNKSSIHVPSS